MNYNKSLLAVVAGLALAADVVAAPPKRVSRRPDRLAPDVEIQRDQSRSKSPARRVVIDDEAAVSVAPATRTASVDTVIVDPVLDGAPAIVVTPPADDVVVFVDPVASVAPASSLSASETVVLSDQSQGLPEAAVASMYASFKDAPAAPASVIIADAVVNVADAVVPALDAVPVAEVPAPVDPVAPAAPAAPVAEPVVDPVAPAAPAAPAVEPVAQPAPAVDPVAPVAPGRLASAFSTLANVVSAPGKFTVAAFTFVGGVLTHNPVANNARVRAMSNYLATSRLGVKISAGNGRLRQMYANNEVKCNLLITAVLLAGGYTLAQLKADNEAGLFDAKDDSKEDALAKDKEDLEKWFANNKAANVDLPVVNSEVQA
jgi:hypothetical protein